MAGRKTRTFGTIRKLPSGRWQARYRDGDGLLRSAPDTFVRKTDAARWLTLTEAELAAGTWIDPDAGRIPFTDYAQEWITERPNLRPKTIQLYRYLLRRHLRPAFAGNTLAGITDADVRRWRSDLLAAGVSPVTTAKAYRLLKAILATAVEDQSIRRNPCRIRAPASRNHPNGPPSPCRRSTSWQTRLASVTAPWCSSVVSAACAGASWSPCAAPTSTPTAVCSTFGGNWSKSPAGRLFSRT